MRVIGLIKKTSGGRHGWYEAEHRGNRFNVRKPLGFAEMRIQADAAFAPLPQQKAPAAALPWWRRVWAWIVRHAA